MKPRLLPVPLAAALFALLGHFPEARATVLVDLSVDELAQRADLVVIANITDQWVAWDEADSRVKTYTRVRLESVVTPTDAPELPGADLLIEQEGGFLGDWGVYVAGDARLVPGERALLFLLRGGGRYFIYGMEQGKYDISSDSGTPQVFRATTVPVAVPGVSGAPMTMHEPTAPWNGHALDELVEHLRAVREVAP